MSSRRQSYLHCSRLRQAMTLSFSKRCQKVIATPQFGKVVDIHQRQAVSLLVVCHAVSGILQWGRWRNARTRIVQERLSKKIVVFRIRKGRWCDAEDQTGRREEQRRTKYWTMSTPLEILIVPNEGHHSVQQHFSSIEYTSKYQSSSMYLPLLAAAIPTKKTRKKSKYIRYECHTPLPYLAAYHAPLPLQTKRIVFVNSPCNC